MPFYAKYPATSVTMSGTSTVQGPGTAGAQSGGVLTVQGDPAGTPIPVSGTVSATNPSVGATGAAVPASGTYIAGNNAGTLVGLVTDSSSRLIQVGAGVAGTPAGGVVSIQGVAAGTVVPISGTVTANQGGTWNINNVSGTVSLPTGASTSALQTTGNTSLSSIDGKLGSLGQKTMAGSAPVVIASDQSAVPISGSVTVSGTVAATQSGTWTVQPGNTANTTPWLATISQGGNSATVSAGGALKVDASASTQPVSGTVTANQGTSPWIVAGGGTAGTAASGVVTIQGIASMTAVKTDGSATTQPVSGTVAATQSGTWNIGTVTTVSAVTAITNALPAGTNLMGKVGIDQTTPGTTNGVVVNTIAPVTTTTAAFQAEGSIAFGSITNAFQTIFTPSAATKILQMRNNTDVSIAVSFDAGTTTNYVLDTFDAVSLDLLSNALVMSTTAIQIKYSVGAPTSGSFRINGCH